LKAHDATVYIKLLYCKKMPTVHCSSAQKGFVMPEIRPFRGYRFRLDHPDDLGALAAPPYDMISPEIQEDLLIRHPHNTVRITQHPALPADTANRDRHDRAARLFDTWIHDRVIVKDEHPSIYLYRQRFSVPEHGGKEPCERVALIARVKLVDFKENIIIPHEYTLSGPKLDRYEHLSALRCNTGLIFGIITDDGSFFRSVRQGISENPDGRFIDAGGVEHALFPITNPDLIAACQDSAAQRSILIADGHHRYETALQYARETGRPEDSYVMMGIVSTNDPGLIIRSFQRCIKRTAERSSAAVLDGLRSLFDMAPLGDATPSAVRAALADLEDESMCFVEASSGTLFRVRPNGSGIDCALSNADGRSDQWNRLSVSIINALVIGKILGITPNSENLHEMIDYMPDPDDALAKIGRGVHHYGAFLLKPISIATIREITARGERLPQKSTLFYPKLFSGLVFNRLEHA
jgi:uncharacterized protein (DUF1015 family)